MRFIFEDFTLVPYTRMTQRGKWVVPKAKKYIQNQTALGWGYKTQMLQNDWSMFPPQTPLYLRIRIQRPDLYTYDLDNAIKAALDAAQNIVFGDDRYIVEIRAALKVKGRAKLEIEINSIADL